MMFPFFELANLIMTYLLAVVVIATRHGRGPSVIASVMSVAAFDFFFVPPYLTFAVADTQYLLTFAVMLVVGLVISGLTVRIRLQAEAARQREQRPAALSAMSRELAEAGAIDDLVATAARHITEVFGAEVAVLLPDAEGNLQARRNEARFPLEENDLMRSRWAFEHRQPAGLGTAVSDAAHAVHLPLLGQRGPIGVVSVRPRRRDAFTTPEPLRQLETFVNQTALALERTRLADEAQDARVRAETERLRNALLTSVSHDLRTPLAAITGAATTILDGGARLDQQVQQELMESVRDEAERLNRLVQNLLEMTRLESRALPLPEEGHPLGGGIGAALSHPPQRLPEPPAATPGPPPPPPVADHDALLAQQ